MKRRTDQYTYRITWSEEDKEFVGLCAEFPSLSWLAGTQEAALQGIRKLVDEVVADMENNNEPVPQPLAARRYSGRLIVRIPPHVHRELTIQAAEAKVSINRLISSRLASV
jgi:predicted HicB family RNase H-like nuclease